MAPSVKQETPSQPVSHTIESGTEDLLSRIAVPKVSFADLLNVDTLESRKSNREQMMDSQIELHQDMLFQNNYVLRKSVTESSESHPLLLGDLMKSSGFEFAITSSEDDTELGRGLETRRMNRKRSTSEVSPTHLISSVLSAQNVGVGGGLERVGPVCGAGGSCFGGELAVLRCASF